MWLCLTLSLQGAPLLSIKEIGQGGAKFVAQLLETQMFCNYCQKAKLDSAAIATHKSQSAISHPAASTALTVSTSLPGDLSGSQAGGAATPMQAGVAGRSRSRSRALSNVGGEEASRELDALHAVFELALTGTVAMDPASLGAAKETFRRLYPDVSDDFAANSAEVDSLLTKYATSLEAAASRSPHITNAVCDEFLRSSSAGRNFSLLLPWCNGLTCGGQANSALCSPICVQLWQRSVQQLRQESVVQDIVSRHHHAPFVTKTHVLKAPAALGEAAGPTVRVSLKPKLEAVRHGRETESQYLQRKQIIDSASSPTVATSPAKTQERAASGAARKSVAVRGPNLKYIPGAAADSADRSGRKRITYARSSTADAATMLIARHYVQKQEKVIAQRRKRALRVVRRFLLRFVFFFRKIKFIDSVVRLQAFARGYIIRCHIAAIVEALIARKIERLLACVRIRNFLRAHDSAIARRWARRKAEEQRRKRSLISIPAATPSSPATAPSSYSLVKTTEGLRAGAVQKSIRDGEAGGALKLVSSLYGQAPDHLRSASADPLTTAAKDVKFTSPVRAPMPPPTRGHSLSGAAAGLKTLFEAVDEDSLEGMPSPPRPADTSLIDKLNASYNQMRRPSLQSDAGSTTGSVTAAGSSSGTAKKFSPRTYSEKAKEFLQFGKILHRTASSTPRRSTIYSFQHKQPSEPAPALQQVSLKPNSDAAAPPFGGKRGFEHLTISIKSTSSDAESLALPPSTGSSSSQDAFTPMATFRSSEGSKAMNGASNDSIGGELRRSRLESSSSVLSSSGGEEQRHMVVSPTSGIPILAGEYDSSDEEDRPERATLGGDRRKERQSLRASFLSRPRKAHNSNYISADTSNFASQFLELESSSQDVRAALGSDVAFSSGEVTARADKAGPTSDSDSKSLRGSDDETRGALLVSRLFSAPHTSLSPSLPRVASRPEHGRLSDQGSVTDSAAAESIQAAAPEQRRRRSTGGHGSSLLNMHEGGKKVSPIGRYAAQHNYDIAKIVSTASHYERASGPALRLSVSPSNKAVVAGIQEVRALEPEDLLSMSLDLHSEGLCVNTSPFSGMAAQNEHSAEKTSGGVSGVPSLTKSQLTNSGSVSESVLSAASSASSVTNEDAKLKLWLGDGSGSESGDAEEEEEDLDGPVGDDLTQELQVLPLRTLGSNVLELLGRQQLQLIKSMWALLRGGVEVLKHGRKGKPKFKALFCDVSMAKLYWRVPGSKPDPDLDESDAEPPLPVQHRAGNRRSSYVKTNADRVILFKEILEVRCCLLPLPLLR